MPAVFGRSHRMGLLPRLTGGQRAILLDTCAVKRLTNLPAFHHVGLHFGLGRGIRGGGYLVAGRISDCLRRRLGRRRRLVWGRGLCLRRGLCSRAGNRPGPFRQTFPAPRLGQRMLPATGLTGGPHAQRQHDRQQHARNQREQGAEMQDHRQHQYQHRDQQQR